MQRAPALADQSCAPGGGGGGMEPATAPRPDMAPELTPEEEQVSAAAAVGVSELPRPRPASARQAALLAPGPPRSCSRFRPAGWPPRPETAPQAAACPSREPRDPWL